MELNSEGKAALAEVNAAAWKLAAIIGRRPAAEFIQKVVIEVSHGNISDSRGTSQFDDRAQQWE